MRIWQFIILLLIYVGSSLVHFNDGPEYFTRGNAQVFIPLVRFLLQNLVFEILEVF